MLAEMLTTYASYAILYTCKRCEHIAREENKTENVRKGQKESITYECY